MDTALICSHCCSPQLHPCAGHHPPRQNSEHLPFRKTEAQMSSPSINSSAKSRRN
uniref:Uncharacterized protein n=1 Tax=Arundo donax TaxID=35708 RepID=A0A0A9C8J4_ARUDO